MTSFDYAADGFTVRKAVADTHQTSWDAIGRSGSHWRSHERVEIARQARAARAARVDPPWLRKGLPEPQGLPEVAAGAARKIAADAHQIDRPWAERQIAALGAERYVELVSVVVTVAAIDAFAEALGRAHAPLPEPIDADAPDGERADGTGDIGAYLPMVDPFPGPNVGRALSLVPAANTLFFSNVMQMYATEGGGFYDMVWPGPFERPQAELLAARVSAVNECFY
ncbi:MAG: hypothetical protein AAF430_12140 [Myxococcota bacterium]